MPYYPARPSLAPTQVGRKSEDCPKRSKLVDEILANAELEQAQYERERPDPRDVYWKKPKKKAPRV